MYRACSARLRVPCVSMDAASILAAAAAVVVAHPPFCYLFASNPLWNSCATISMFFPAPINTACSINITDRPSRLPYSLLATVFFALLCCWCWCFGWIRRSCCCVDASRLYKYYISLFFSIHNFHIPVEQQSDDGILILASLALSVNRKKIWLYWKSAKLHPFFS